MASGQQNINSIQDEQKKKEVKELTAIANFISEKGLKFKQSLCIDRQVDYFRGDNFHEIVIQNKDIILKMFKEIKYITQLEKLEDSIRLGQLFIDYKLLIPLDRHPGYKEEQKKRYPKHLIIPRQGPYKMTEKGFYMWQIPKPYGKITLFLTLGVLVVIAFMCINIWPMWLKIAIWYFSFYALVFLMSLILARLFVWLFLFHFGLDLWIFPNFFIDSYDLLDSFRPIISFEVRSDDVKMYIIRLVSAISLIFLFYQLAQEPDTLDSFTKFTGENMDDLFNWGNDKFVLGKLPDRGNSTKRKKSARELFEEAILGEPEEQELKNNEQKTEEQPKDEEKEYEENDTDNEVDDKNKNQEDEDDKDKDSDNQKQEV